MIDLSRVDDGRDEQPWEWVPTRGSLDLVVADDSGADAELTLSALQRAYPGLHARWVGDGRALLHSLQKTHGALPKIVITDLHMPGMCGTALVEKLRNNPALHAIPIIAMSADATPQELLDLKRLGVETFVEKSVDYAVFAKKLASQVAAFLEPAFIARSTCIESSNCEVVPPRCGSDLQCVLSAL